MGRKIGLDHHFAGERSPAGAAGDLEQQCRKPLRRAEIGAVERIVRAEHADEREPWKIVALGQHLRPDEDVDLAGFDLIAHRGESADAARAVAVDARDARCGKALRERALEPLRPATERLKVDVAAFGAGARKALGMTAMVAAQHSRIAMNDETRACSACIRPASRTTSTGATARSRAG